MWVGVGGDGSVVNDTSVSTIPKVALDQEDLGAHHRTDQEGQYKHGGTSEAVSCRDDNSVLSTFVLVA